MRKLIIALLLSLIAILSTTYYGQNVTPVAKAGDYWFGYPLIGGTNANAAANYTFYNNYTITTPAEYIFHVDRFFVYVSNASVGIWVRGGIYDSNGYLLANTTKIDINGAGWYNATIDVKLLSGNYWIGVFTVNQTIYYRDELASEQMNGTTPCTDLPSFSTFPNIGNRIFSSYVTYDLEPYFVAPIFETNFSALMPFGALLILIVVALLLAWKSNVPILNFVFGAFTIGIAVYLAGATMVLAGWMNLLAIVMGTLCMLSGGIRLREA